MKHKQWAEVYLFKCPYMIIICHIWYSLLYYYYYNCHCTSIMMMIKYSQAQNERNQKHQANAVHEEHRFIQFFSFCPHCMLFGQESIDSTLHTYLHVLYRYICEEKYTYPSYVYIQNGHVGKICSLFARASHWSLHLSFIFFKTAAAIFFSLVSHVSGSWIWIRLLRSIFFFFSWKSFRFAANRKLWLIGPTKHLFLLHSNECLRIQGNSLLYILLYENLSEPSIHVGQEVITMEILKRWVNFEAEQEKKKL